MLISSQIQKEDGTAGWFELGTPNRPVIPRSWRSRFKFDDEMVTPCSEFAAVEDNYGGECCAG